MTLFFENSQAEFGIGLTLTIMLVMYTMYQSINESVSKTAYMKMIDYWLVFCLLVPFLIFLIEVRWMLLKNSVEDDSSNATRWEKVNNCRRMIKRRKQVQIIVPVMTFLFITFFFTAAMIISN